MSQKRKKSIIASGRKSVVQKTAPEPTQISGLVDPQPEEVGYWRVSTGRDQSPDMQIAALKRRGIPDENIFGDIKSGRKDKRKGLERALRLMAGRPGWTLVFWKLDRLGRDRDELLRLNREFREEGLNMVSLTENIDTRTPIGQLFFGMFAIFAQYESDCIKERTAAGMRHAQQVGISQIGRKPKLKPAQWVKVEKLLLSKRAKPLSIGRIAHRFRISASLVNLYFPKWRSKTKKERNVFRRANPLPSNY